MAGDRERKGLLGRLMDVLRGADTVFGEVPHAAEAATLRREVEERDERIRALEASCAELERAATQAGESGRESAVVDVLEDVSGPLAQLATLRSLADRGTMPQTEDVLRLTGALQKAFEAVGLEPIGEVGEVMPYDASLCRPMGREQFRDGEEAVVKFVGFRLGERVVRPALVGREGQ